jgi:hypothetical protein
LIPLTPALAAAIVVFADQQQQQMQQQLPLQHYHHHHQQQQQPLAPFYSGRVSNGIATAYSNGIATAYSGGRPTTVAYHPQFTAGQHQQQPLPASITAVAAAAAAAAARNPKSSWTDSRKQLEANLAIEQSISHMQQGPDYLTEQQRLMHRLTRLRLEVQLSVADGNCQVGSSHSSSVV